MLNKTLYLHLLKFLNFKLVTWKTTFDLAAFWVEIEKIDGLIFKAELSKIVFLVFITTKVQKTSTLLETVALDSVANLFVLYNKMRLFEST